MITEKIVIGIGSVFAFGTIVKLSFGKIVSAINTYQNNIKNNLLEAENIKLEAEKLLKKYQQQKNELQGSIDKNISSAKQAAEEIILRSQESAKKNVQKKIENAKREIDINGSNMLQDLDKKFITLTIERIKDQEINNPSSLKQGVSQDSLTSEINSFKGQKSFH